MRKMKLRQIQAVAKGLEVNVAAMRKAMNEYNEAVAKLDSPESKRKYHAAHLAQQKADKRAEAVTRTGTALQTMVANSRDAVAEKGAWSRDALVAELLRSARFTPAPAGKAETTEEKLLAMMTELVEATKRGNALLVASRLDDERLGDAAQAAAAAGDVATLSVLVNEAAGRKGEQLRTKVKAAVDALPVPEADEAEDTLDTIDSLLREGAAIVQVVSEPHNQYAQNTLSYFNYAREHGRPKKDRTAGAEPARAEVEEGQPAVKAPAPEIQVVPAAELPAA